MHVVLTALGAGDWILSIYTIHQFDIDSCGTQLYVHILTEWFKGETIDPYNWSTFTSDRQSPLFVHVNSIPTIPMNIHSMFLGYIHHKGDIDR